MHPPLRSPRSLGSYALHPRCLASLGNADVRGIRPRPLRRSSGAGAHTRRSAFGHASRAPAAIWAIHTSAPPAPRGDGGHAAAWLRPDYPVCGYFALEICSSASPMNDSAFTISSKCFSAFSTYENTSYSISIILSDTFAVAVRTSNR